DQWGRVLEVLMRYQALGFVVAMTTGAAVYDPKLMGQAADFFGLGIVLSQDITMRFPLYLTFVLALLAFFSTLKMTEVEDSPADSETGNLKQTLAMTFKAGAWIVQTPFVFAVMLFGMLFDGVIRMVITLSSQYYRMIDIPESIFGLMGSGVALLGMVIPKIARQIAENRSPVQALFVTAILAGAGLVSMNFFWPWIGLVPALLTFSAMYFTGFFVSFYVNREADSRQRATVLSFKGLSYNISYGVLGILYALVLKLEKNGIPDKETLASDTVENLVFMDTFFWFPTFFAAGFLCFVIICFFWLRPLKQQ
ncbi:MAG: MFS transporter, partial [Desulfobacteraceae bacterium]|nr:MFS transporter [Desulfobacteraceae bacterium]